MKGFLDRLNPADDIELGIIEEMLVAFWRQRRAWAIETRMIDSAMGQAAGSDPMSRLAEAFASAAGDRLDLVHRYEARLHRIFHRSLRNLLMIRSAAMAPPEPELPDETPAAPPSGQQDSPAEEDHVNGEPHNGACGEDPEGCPPESRHDVPENVPGPGPVATGRPRMPATVDLPRLHASTKICQTNLEVQWSQRALPTFHSPRLANGSCLPGRAPGPRRRQRRLRGRVRK
jgi:hypothetical protein